jgi:hypothetical protein
MAEKNEKKAGRKGGSALDLPMAALAAASAGFAAFAMPADLFESVVAATGLPGIVSAAQPPLGGTARLAFVAVVAAVTFTGVWFLLRALGQPAAPRRKPEPAENEPIRRRRADAHPDAPARAPIRAGNDLGVPLDSITVEEREVTEVEDADFEAEWQRPTPSFLRRADEPEQAETAAEPEAEEIAPEADAAEPSEVPFWVPEGEADESAPVVDEAEEEDGQPDPAVLPFWPLQADAKSGAEPDPEPPVDELVSRLEGGLIRRKREGGRRPHRPVDDRLRGALSDLNKLSRRR